MHNLEHSPVYREFMRQYRENPDSFDLSKLWIAGGRKRGKSPRCVLRRELRDQWPYDDPGGKADTPITAPLLTTWWYIPALDMRLWATLGKVFGFGRGMGPVASVIDAGDDPLVGILAAVAVRRYNDCSHTEAGDLIIHNVAVQTADLGVIRRETIVARAQRAVRGQEPIGLGKGSL